MSPGCTPPVLWNNGGQATLFTGIDGIAYGINNANQFVGRYDVSGVGTHAFLADGTLVTDLGTLGGKDSTATAINDQGQIVGYSDITEDPSTTHPFLWTNGTMTDMGLLEGFQNGIAYDINEQGQVVGIFGDSLGFAVAGFLYENGVIVDLNSLIDPASGWSLTAANGINDFGYIVGYGTIQGETHGFLLTPVPEPSSCVLLSLILLTVRKPSI